MQVLHQLPHAKEKDLIVGIETADDAAVYRVSDDTAIITTLDFFPPIVDDPYTFGQIAAANALSDVYAMGGAPRLAMNIVSFPPELDLSVLNEILRGSLDKLREADVLLVGGHSIEDREIKYGLSVTGFVHPDRVVTNKGARPGDVLVLTKPIGVGVITTAMLAGRCRPSEAVEALDSMTELNRRASEAMVETGASACTDVTGFGLLGHALEMAEGSGAGIVICSADVEFFPAALNLVRKKSNRPRTLASNIDFLSGDIKINRGINKEKELLLYDPQTSGGLLISVPKEKASSLLKGLDKRGVRGAVIGGVVERKRGWKILVE